MSDKILTEAFDKLKAIEESDDPFCIGAEKEKEVTETYTEICEDEGIWDLAFDNDIVELSRDGSPEVTIPRDQWNNMVDEYVKAIERR